MPDFELTPAQQKALDTSKNVAVTAGAGSGKTGVLVERYIKSLQDDASIGTRNVLAITFTDKAAAEMKARVRDELEKRIKRAKDAVRWRDVLDTLDRAAISTIHSFCGALLREHPIEAEIDPLFETLDESESGRLRDQAVEDALQGAGDDDALRSHAQVLLRNWSRQRATDNIRMLLGGSGSHDEWAAFYRDADDETIRENIRTLVEKEVAHRAKKLFSREMIRSLAAFTCTRPDKIEQVRQETLDALHGGLLDTESIPDLVESLTAITLRGGSARNWDDFDGCKKLLGEIRNSAKELAALAVGETDWNAIPVLRALSTLYMHSREIYEQYKGGGRALDFDDLQTRTLQLLKQNKGNIRRELHRRFHAVLVDEFQDTNHLQWEIIRLIVEPPDGSIPPGKLFIVGDPKQSIYGFRNAEIRVFADVKNHCIEGPGQVEMDDNFRSTPAVVAFVNRLMPGLMGATGLTYDPDYRELVCRLHTSLEGSVALLLPQKATAGERDDDEPHAAETEAELVARQLQHFVQSGSTVWDKAERAERPARYGDMAILLRARTRLGLFEEALRKVDIPFTVAGGFAFYERQEVLDVVNVLRFLLHQGDDVALAAVLRSPMAGISDDALYRISRATGGSLWAKLQNIDATPDADDTDAVRRTRNLIQTWLRWSRRMPVAELLAHVLEDTALWGVAAAGERGPQAIANIEKMLGLARGAPDLAGLVARLNTAISSGSREADAQTEPDESDAVKLLTIHAAKGLEFPIVCLPDTAAGVRHASASDVYTHRDYGFGIKARDADANIENTVIRTLIAQRTADEEKAESARLLYVALTRARDHLVISGSRSAGKAPRSNTWLSAICERLEIDPLDPRNIDGVTVHLDGSRIDVAEAPRAPGLDELLERYREAGERLRSKSGAAGGQPGLLGPVAGESPLPRFSPTSLALYLECPYAYFLTHVLGVPSVGGLSDELPGPAAKLPGHGSRLVLGNVAHRLFEEISEIEPGREEEVLLQYVKEQEVSDGDEQARIVERIRAMIASFRASDFGGRVLAAQEYYSELSFSVRIGAGVVSGAIDRLYRDTDGWKVLDYKTDNIKERDIPERRERYTPQLMMYSAAVGKLLRCDPPDAYLYFARPAKAVRIPISPDAARAFEQRVAAAIDAILARRFGQAEACHEDCEFHGAAYCSE